MNALAKEVRYHRSLMFEGQNMEVHSVYATLATILYCILEVQPSDDSLFTSEDKISPGIMAPQRGGVRQSPCKI